MIKIITAILIFNFSSLAHAENCRELYGQKFLEDTLDKFDKEFYRHMVSRAISAFKRSGYEISESNIELSEDVFYELKKTEKSGRNEYWYTFSLRVPSLMTVKLVKDGELKTFVFHGALKDKPFAHGRGNIVPVKEFNSVDQYIGSFCHYVAQGGQPWYGFYGSESGKLKFGGSPDKIEGPKYSIRVDGL